MERQDGSDGAEPLMVKPRISGPVWRRVRSVLPVVEWLPRYDWRRNLKHDVVGGVTLSFILVGQSLAHASLCQVTLINGPYSCMLPPLAYAVFGTGVHASVGTGGLVSLLTGEQLLYYGNDAETRTRVGAVLTLEVGALLLLMGVCRLGFLVRFLSRPALSGFITASAVLIICSQLAPMLGLPEWATKGGIVEIVAHHATFLELTNWPTVVLSALALAFLLNAQRFNKLPLLRFLSDFKELVLIAFGAAACKLVNRSVADERKIAVIGAMPSGLPSPRMPSGTSDLHLVKELFPSAALVAAVVFICSFAAVKKFAMRDGYQVRGLNELCAIGAANVISALCGGVPVQVGLSRMGIARMCGVQSQLGANVLVGGAVAGIIYFFSPYLYDVPRCVLSCIIVSGATHLTEFGQCRELWALARNHRYHCKTRGEVLVWLAGFLCTLYAGPFSGMVIAIMISLFLVLYQVVNPEIVALGYLPGAPDAPSGPHGRRWVNLEHHEGAREEDGILVFRLEGPLFYANVESLQEWLDEREITREEEGHEPYKGIILSAGAVPFVDTTAAKVLEDMIHHYQERNILLFIANRFGQSGRFIKDKLETLERKSLHTQGLRQEMASCSTIDDFVALIREHFEADRVHLTTTCRSRRSRTATDTPA